MSKKAERRFIQLRSNDDVVFKIGQKAAGLMQTMRLILHLDEEGAFQSKNESDDIMNISTADARILEMVIRWCQFHKDDPSLQTESEQDCIVETDIEDDSGDSALEDEDDNSDTLAAWSQESPLSETGCSGDGAGASTQAEVTTEVGGKRSARADVGGDPGGDMAGGGKRKKRSVDGREVCYDESQFLGKPEAFNVAFFQVDNRTLFDLLKTANYLDIRSMLEEGGKCLAKKLTGKTTQQMIQAMKF